MEQQVHYEAYFEGEMKAGLRAVNGTGVVTHEIGDLSDNFQRLDNVAALYNANRLMPENFAHVTECLVGILI